MEFPEEIARELFETCDGCARLRRDPHYHLREICRRRRAAHPEPPSTDGGSLVPGGCEGIATLSDALAARNTVDQVFTGLLVGVGSIALLVGGIGVANTMVITVLERRKEIGLRRSLSATRAHIRAQFLAEAILVALLGGLAGVLLGVGVTGAVALLNGWPLAVPVAIPIGGLAATLAVGAIAGVLPAVRASRTPPTAALSS